MTTTTRRLPVPRSAAPLIGLLALVLATGACAGGAPAAPGTASEAPPASASDSGSGSGSAEDTATDTTEPTSPDAPTTAEAAFRSWLAASRAPDTATACGLMAPALVDRMVTEMTAQGWPGITDCASMITTTAELYAAVGDVPEVELSVLEERPDATVLSVAYVGGDCGTAVMAPRGAGWIITEQSEEQC